MFTLTFMCKMPFYAMFTDWILLFKLCLLVVPNKNICLIGFLAKKPPKNNNNNKTIQTKTQTKNNTENVQVLSSHWNKASFLACEPHEKYIYRLFCYSLTEKKYRTSDKLPQGMYGELGGLIILLYWLYALERENLTSQS